jgi:hypothetical protein
LKTQSKRERKKREREREERKEREHRDRGRDNEKNSVQQSPYILTLDRNDSKIPKIVVRA